MNGLLSLGGSIGLLDLFATWAVQATMVLAAGLVAGRLLERLGPAVQSALYRTTLAAVVLCPVASAVLAALGFGGVVVRLPVAREMWDQRTDRVELPGVVVATPLPHRTDTGDGPRLDEVQGTRLVEGPSREMAVGLAGREAGERGSTPVGVRPIEESTVLETGSIGAVVKVLGWALIGLWVLGSVVFGARLVIDHWRMSRLRSGAVSAEAEVQEVCRELARQIAVGAPLVLRSPYLSSPCLDGVRRPAILLPDDDDDRASLADTLVHELAHLWRRDGLWNLARLSVTSVFWVHPLLWMLSRRIEVTAEEVCDDFVVEFGADRTRYAGLLLDLAERRLPMVAPAGVGMISFRSLLSRRIMRILDSSRTLSTRAGRRVVAMTLACGLVGTVLAGLVGVGERVAVVRAKSADSAVEVRNAVAEDVPITGRILDLEGRPVVGARVQVKEVTRAKRDGLSGWLEAVKRGEPQFGAHVNLSEKPDSPLSARPSVAITDKAGRFRIDGVGRERVVEMTIQGPSIAFSPMIVVTRRMEPVPAKGFPNPNGPGFQTVYGSDFTRTMPPGRVVEGMVREAKTKKPMPGVQVWSERFSGSNYVGIRNLQTTSDQAGRFRLEGFPKGKENQLLAVPNDDQPYLMRELTIPDAEGIGPIALDIDLHQGIWIKGKVIDHETKQPVGYARLHYLPFLSNTFAQAMPEFTRNGLVDGLSNQIRYQTKEDGTYRLVGLPGRAIVGVLAQTPGRPYVSGAGAEKIKGIDKEGRFATYLNPIEAGRTWPNSMVEIEPSEGVREVNVDLELYLGGTARLRLVDSSGVAVTGATTAGRLHRGQVDREETSADLEVAGLGQDEERAVMVRHLGRKIGKVVRVKAGDGAKGPMSLTLEPLAAIIGRVVDASGSPLVAAEIDPRLLPTEDFALDLSHVISDMDGRFTISDVPVGCDYSLAVHVRRGFNHSELAFKERVSVTPGETTEVGEIRFERD